MNELLNNFYQFILINNKLLSHKQNKIEAESKDQTNKN